MNTTLRYLFVSIAVTLPISCDAKDPATASTCDAAAALVATQYNDHRSESDESLIRKTGHPRLYYQAVLEPELTEERIKAILASPKVSSSIMASLSLAGDAGKLSRLARAGLGANIYSDEGVPVIVIAAGCKRVDTVNELLKAGADVYAHDRQHMDAMAAAILEDSDEIVVALTEHGYKIDNEKKSGKITSRLAQSLHDGKYGSLLKRTKAPDNREK